MKGMFLGNLDINLFLTQKEFNKISSKPLECILQQDDFSDSERKANLQYEEFDDGGDGITVRYEIEKRNYIVKANNKALTNINLRGEFGTRYGMGEKITIYIKDRIERTGLIMMLYGEFGKL